MNRFILSVFVAIGFALFVCADEAYWSTSGYGTSGDVTIEYNETKTLIIDTSVSLAKLTVKGVPNAVLTLNLVEGGSFVAESVNVESGILQQGTASVLGPTPQISILDGATFDMNGLSINSATKVYIAGDGAGDWPWALTSSSDASGNILGGVYLTADATVGGDQNIKIGQSGAGYFLYLQGKTLKKIGGGALVGANMNTPGEGAIDVHSGSMSVNHWNNLNSSQGDTTLILRDGTQFANNTDRIISVKNLESHGATFANKAIGVKGEMKGFGSFQNLAFNDGVGASLMGDVTVTGQLTLNGRAFFSKDENCQSGASISVATLVAPNSATITVGEGVVFNLGSARTGAKFDVNGTLKVIMAEGEDIISLNIVNEPNKVEAVDSNGNPLDVQVIYSEGATHCIVEKVPQNVWTPQNDLKLSTVENWSQKRLPENGEKFAIHTSGNIEVTIDISLKTSYASVSGNGTVAFVDSGENELVVSNMYAFTTVVVKGSAFQPQLVNIENGATLAIDGGYLRDAIFSYSGVFPASGDAFSATTLDSDVVNSENWSGTIWVKDVANMVGTGNGNNVFKPNDWGNASSKVRVSSLKGWIFASTSEDTNTIVPEIELEDIGSTPAIWLNDGYSYGGNGVAQFTKISKLSGGGTIKCDGSAPGVLLNIRNWEKFSGALSITNKCVVFGHSIPPTQGYGGSRIYIMENAEVSVPEGKIWVTQNSDPDGIYVKGTLRMSSLDRIEANTKIKVEETGKLVLFNNQNVLEQNKDFSRVSGSGVLKLESSGNYWRTVSTNNYPVTMPLECAQQNSVLFPFPGVVHNVGSLMGNGNIRSDYDSGNRDVRIFQSRDTSWSGLFANDDRIGTVYVTNALESAAMLTFGGEQTHDNNLVLESGSSVNIAGKWKGNVTVSSGSVLSGTGMIEGNLTLSDGAILRANTESEIPLTINGGVISSDDVTVTIEIPECKTTRRFVLITANSGLSNINFVCTNSAYSVRVTDTSVTVSRKGFSVIVR